MDTETLVQPIAEVDLAARKALRQCATSIGDPAEIRIHASFAYHRGSSNGPATAAAFDRFEFAWSAPESVSAWAISNAQIAGRRFALVGAGALVQESLYLNRDPHGSVPRSLATRHSLRGGVLALGNAATCRNYYHLTAQYLTALIHYQQVLANTVTDYVLVSPDLGIVGNRALQVLGLNSLTHLVLPSTATVSADVVVYSDILGDTGPKTPVSARQELAARVKASLGLKRSLASRRIYVSRRDTERRRMQNESELEAFLEKLGFEIVSCGALTFDEQVRLFHEAECIVSPHGAALTNVLYCQPGAKVLELFPRSYANPCMKALAQSSGVSYWCDLFDDDGRAHDTRDWNVDISVIGETIRAMAPTSSSAT